MDPIRLKIKNLMFIKFMLMAVTMTFVMVYVTKYVNMNLDISQLNVANILIALVTISTLQVVKRDDVLNLLQRNVVVLTLVTTCLEWVIIGLVLYDPMTYVVGYALFKGAIMKIHNSAFQDFNNEIFQGRQRTKLGNHISQAEYLGILLGGIAGWCFPNVELMWVVLMGAGMQLIIIPLRMWRLKLIFQILKSEGKLQEAQH